MNKLNSPLLLNILLCLLSGIISYSVHAQPNITHSDDFNKQLFIIENSTDKNNALVKLQQLSGVKDLSKLQRFSVFSAQGKLQLSLTRYKQAIESFSQAKNIATALDDYSLKAQVSKYLGVVYYYQGELPQALSSYQQSLTYVDKQADINNKQLSIQRANLLNNIALVYSFMNKHTESLQHYQLAEAIYQSYGSQADKVDVRFNIALLHVKLKRFDIAITMLKEVIVKFKLLDSHLDIAKATAGLGLAYKHSGQYELAKSHILTALAYFQKYGYLHDSASQLHNISSVYTYLGHYEQAIDYAEKTITLSQQVGHQRAYAGALQVLAKSYFYLGDLRLAKENIDLSNTIAVKINYQAILIDNLAMSALIYSGLGKPRQALSDFLAYERVQHDADNLLLNEQLAKFESEQLAQQVLQLQQKRELKKLETTKTDQQRNFLLLALVLTLLLLFSIYRRYLETRVTTELEKRVRQRTQELELTAQDLTQANQIKSQFLANMSHEIRTPLTAIVGHAEAIIHNDVEQEHLIKEVDIIHGNSLHLLELINDILDLSKIEAEKFQLELRPQNLENIIQELADMFSEQALKKGLGFSIEHQLSMPFVINVDGRRLRQILINLCSNAVKFTPQGNVTLSIHWCDSSLSFAVKDTGIGLAADQIQQVFEIFTQADSTISRRFGGSGLGLSLSNQLAKLMGGNITLQSELGKGSCFLFSLPCSVITENILVKNIGNHSVLPIASQKAEQVTGKILLAEDHDDNRRLIARLLEGLGLEVLCAKNGIEAIELCKQHKPPLLLLDIQMPEMDGVTAFTQLRALGFSQPIYALTANAMSHEISQYLALGFTGHLKKPIERVSFINTIAQHYTNINASESTLYVESMSTLIDDFKTSLEAEKKILTDYLTSNNKKQESLAIAVHRISGAGQMFGFTELSQIAKELDCYLKNTKAVDVILTADEQQQQNSFIEGLTCCLIDEIALAQSA